LHQPKEVVKEIEFCRLELHKDDLEVLLFGWLNSLIYFLAVEILLFKMFNISELAEEYLKAIYCAEKYYLFRH
jgi:SHS2 domain-containing protein